MGLEKTWKFISPRIDFKGNFLRKRGGNSNENAGTVDFNRLLADCEMIKYFTDGKVNKYFTCAVIGFHRGFPHLFHSEISFSDFPSLKK